jgi:hypothetical protein
MDSNGYSEMGEILIGMGVFVLLAALAGLLSSTY